MSRMPAGVFETMSGGEMKNVFVSYSHRDLDFAKKLVIWLEERGYKVWMDKKRILPGANYLDSIADGIGKADAFIPLLSPESVSSKCSIRWLSVPFFSQSSKTTSC